MGDDTSTGKVEGVAASAALLRKAGLPVGATILIALLSVPGIQARFFDDTDEEAKIKAEVSYELLRVQTTTLAHQVAENAAQVERLRDTINAMLLQRTAVVGSTGRLSTVPPPPPPEIVDAPAPVPVLRPLPANLDDAPAAQQAMAAAGLTDG
jgi:hypothetical protein